MRNEWKMFSRKEQLLTKTGPDGIGRYDFLRLLKREFSETNSEEARGQVLANLANFSYDPINYDFIRSLDIITLFLNELKSDCRRIVHFAAAAICNLSSDPTNCQHIIDKNGVRLISNLLKNSDEDIILNAIACLIFLRENSTCNDIPDLVKLKISEEIRCLQQSKRSVRIRNLATIFLEEQDVAQNAPRQQEGNCG